MIVTQSIQLIDPRLLNEREARIQTPARPQPRTFKNPVIRSCITYTLENSLFIGRQRWAVGLDTLIFLSIEPRQSVWKCIVKYRNHSKWRVSGEFSWGWYYLRYKLMIFYLAFYFSSPAQWCMLTTKWSTLLQKNMSKLKLTLNLEIVNLSK